MYLLLLFFLLKSCFVSNNELKPIQGNEYLILSLESEKRDVLKKHLIINKANYCNKKIYKNIKYDFAVNKTIYYEVNFINSKDDKPLELKLYDDELSLLESCCFNNLSDYISFMDNASLNIYVGKRV